jgi:hypothetical protein
MGQPATWGAPLSDGGRARWSATRRTIGVIGLPAATAGLAGIGLATGTSALITSPRQADRAWIGSEGVHG